MCIRDRCNVTNITKNIETIDKAISEHEINTNHKISIIQNKIREIDDLNMQTNNDIYLSLIHI